MLTSVFPVSQRPILVYLAPAYPSYLRPTRAPNSTRTNFDISVSPLFLSTYYPSPTQMSAFSSAPIVIDGKGHLLGRLASIISKQVGIDRSKFGRESARNFALGRNESRRMRGRDTGPSGRMTGKRTCGGRRRPGSCVRERTLGRLCPARRDNWQVAGLGGGGRDARLGPLRKPANIANHHEQILSGQKVSVVRCEEINVSGSFFRNKLKYHAYLNSA